MEKNQEKRSDSAFGLKTASSGLGTLNEQRFNVDIEESPNMLRKQERAPTCTGFEVADLQKALEQKKRQSNQYYKGKQVETPVGLPFFRMYGSGIYLFFSFLKQVSILFLFFSIVSIVQIVINYVKGNAFENSESSLQYYVTKASIGNFQYSNQKLTYQQSINYKIANVVVDIVTAVVFLIFCLYWESKSKNIVKDINNSIKLLSSSTLEVVGFPEGVRENKIEQFMNKFGTVSEVAAVKNYSDMIAISKDIYEINLKIKELEIAGQMGEEPDASTKIKQLKEQEKKLQAQSDAIQHVRQQILKFYVQFQKSQQRDEIYNKFKPFQVSCRCCQDPPPEQMLLDNQLITVKRCETEPTGIIWQNAHITWKTRWLRSILQFFIIVAVIVAGFLLIAFLNVLTPPSKDTVDTSQYNWTTIQQESNTTLVESWCIKELSFSAASSYQTLCYKYWKQYIFSILIKVGIAVVIVVLKAVIKIIMVSIAKFQRYTTHTEQSVAIMTNLLITYISTTVLITFLMQANVFKISFKSIIKNFIQDQSLLQNLGQMTEYYDLTSTWYRDIGYQIWFNVFILGFIPHIFMPIVLHFTEWLSEYSAKGQRMYRTMYQKIRPAQFQIEENYANILMIIMIGFVFGGGSPCMIAVSFIGLATRYVYFKYIFVRFCRVPKTYNQSLNDRAISILKAILFIRTLISLYMYGADGIFAMQKSTFMKWTQTLSIPLFSSLFVVVSRIFLTWYYSMFIVAFILIYIFKQILLKNLIKLCHRDEDSNKMQESAGELKDDELISQRSLTKSYKLENNPDYYEILAIMKMKFRKIARQSISPVPVENHE